MQSDALLKRNVRDNHFFHMTHILKTLLIIGYLLIYGCVDSDSKLTQAEQQAKWQQEANRGVQSCICNYLEIEAKNDTFLEYGRILSICNDMSPHYDKLYAIYPSEFKPQQHTPDINKLECKNSISKWLESKQ